MDTVLLIAASLCLIGVFAWEIGKAITARIRKLHRWRIATRPGFEVITKEPCTK